MSSRKVYQTMILPLSQVLSGHVRTVPSAGFNLHMQLTFRVQFTILRREHKSDLKRSGIVYTSIRLMETMGCNYDN